MRLFTCPNETCIEHQLVIETASADPRRPECPCCDTPLDEIEDEAEAA